MPSSAIRRASTGIATGSGATVSADAHTHGPEVHVSAVRISIPEELEEAFLATLPQLLEDAYTDEE